MGPAIPVGGGGAIAIAAIVASAMAADAFIFPPIAGRLGSGAQRLPPVKTVRHRDRGESGSPLTALLNFAALGIPISSVRSLSERVEPRIGNFALTFRSLC
jgi:hypothetical protein